MMDPSPKNPLRINQLEKLYRGQMRVESTLDELRRSIDRLHDVMTKGVQRIERKTTQANLANIVSYSSGLRAQSAPSSRTDGPSEAVEPLMSHLTSQDIFELQEEPSGAQTVDLDPSSDEYLYIRATDEQIDARTTLTRVTTSGETSEGERSPKRDERFKHVQHEFFQDLSIGMVRTDYSRVFELVRQHNMPNAGSTRSTEAPFSKEPGWGGLPLHPTSSGRIAWDCLGILVLMQDSLKVPVNLAWETEIEGVLLVLAFFLATFWTIDMFLNFCTGYSEGGKIIRSWKAIAIRYVRGGFVIDVCVLAVDYTEIIVKLAFPQMSSTSLRALRFLRFAKVTRLVRVVAKLRLGLQTKIDAIWYYRVHKHGLHGYAQYLRLAAMLAKLLIFIAWLCHVGSCVWYFLGRTLTNDSIETWYSNLEDRGSLFHYVMGLYWSLSAMFSGASSQLPNTTWEALLSAVCVVLGALFVTAITSTLAAILIEAQEVQQDMKRKDRLLTSFLEQHSTPVLLALAVRSDFLSHVAATPRLTEQDLPFLPLLAPQLRAALRESHYGHHFMALPAFRILTALQDTAMQDFCFTASSPAILQSGQEVFAAKHEVESAILLTVGKFEYTIGMGLHDKDSLSPQDRNSNEGRRVSVLEGGRRSDVQHHVLPGSWVCELSLFLQWRTSGTLSTCTICELLLVSAEAFIKVVTFSPGMAAFASMYAAHVVEALVKEPSLSPSDIDPAVDCDTLVAGMHVSLRQLVSLPLLDIVKAQQQSGVLMLGNRRRKGLPALEAEILAGKCHLVRGLAGEVRRVVRLVALRLLNSQGKLCVKIGAVQDGVAKAKFQLPGRKLESNEEWEEAVRGILEEEFHELAPYTRFDKVQTFVEDEASESFGIETRYIKTIQTAVLEADLQFASPDVPFNSSGGQAAAGSYSPGVQHEPSLAFRQSSLPLRSLVASPMVDHHTSSAGGPWRSISKSSILSKMTGPSPLLHEGLEYAFAHVGAHREPQIQASTRDNTTFHLFKWVSPEEFDRLSLPRRRLEVENALQPWLTAATYRKFQSMTQWTAVQQVQTMDTMVSIEPFEAFSEGVRVVEEEQSSLSCNTISTIDC